MSAGYVVMVRFTGLNREDVLRALDEMRDDFRENHADSHPDADVWSERIAEVI